MKKRKLKNLNLKKAVISEIGTSKSKGGLHTRYANYADAGVEDAETYEGLGWMSLPYSHCC